MIHWRVLAVVGPVSLRRLELEQLLATIGNYPTVLLVCLYVPNLVLYCCSKGDRDFTRQVLSRSRLVFDSESFRRNKGRYFNSSDDFQLSVLKFNLFAHVALQVKMHGIVTDEPRIPTLQKGLRIFCQNFHNSCTHFLMTQFLFQFSGIIVPRQQRPVFTHPSKRKFYCRMPTSGSTRRFAILGSLE